MRRRLTFLAAAVLALAATGVAIAWGGGAFKTDPVAADFSAARTAWKERICTTSDGHGFRDAKAYLTGEINSSDSRLDGDVVFRLRIREDTTAGLGTAEGRMWIRGKGYARVVGVIANGGITGLIDGRVWRGGWLAANFSASWDGTTLTGALGQGDAANAAVIQSRFDRRCRGKGNGHGNGESKTGKLEVKKSLSPADDPGRFDLQIDGKTLASGAGNNGTTGEQSVKAGSHTVAEAAKSGTSLSNYTTSIVCKDGNGGGGTVASGNSPSLSVNVGKDADVVCVITNTRKSVTTTGKLEVKKDLSPSDDPGRFKLFIKKQDSTTIDSRSDAGDNDSTGENTVPTGTYQVSETADEKVGGGATNLADYDRAITCKSDNGSGSVVASNTDGAPLNVTVASGADVVCVVTNTRKTPKTGKLEVKKDLSPSDDPGRFKLFIKQGSTTIDSRSDAGDNDSTGENTVPTGTYQVSETADEKVGGGATNLADYDRAITCKSDNGSGSVVAANSDGSPLSLSVAEGQDIVCVITNTRKE